MRRCSTQQGVTKECNFVDLVETFYIFLPQSSTMVEQVKVSSTVDLLAVRNDNTSGLITDI